MKISTANRRVLARLIPAAILIVGSFSAFAQPSASNNYIVTREPKVAGKTSLTDTDTAGLIMNVQYIDGLGRALQSVQFKGSPSGKDIVQPIAYDPYQREVIKYLPYASTTATAGYRTTAVANQLSFYSTTSSPPPGVVRTDKPFSETVFEPSPLDRVSEQGFPGNSWQPYDAGISGSGHTAKMSYSANDQSSFSTTPGPTNAGSHKVALYTATINSNFSRTLARASSNTATYATGTLMLTITADENYTAANGCVGTTEEYKDKDGRVVLKRTYNLKSGAVEMLSTYYVYDDYGNLCFVLPPNSNPDATSAISSTTIGEVCYQYRYDARQRLILKRIPGKDWEYLFYNDLDQLICTQDGVQHEKVPQEISFSKYDALGRVVMTGKTTLSGTNSSTPLDTVRARITNGSNAATSRWEIPNKSTVTGYTNNAYPNTGTITTLTFNYYDNYTEIPNLPANYASPAITPSAMTRGLLTASKTAVLNTPTDTLWTVNYYDNDGRLTTNYKQHYKGGSAGYHLNNFDEITNTYNFNDLPTQVARKHYINITGVKTLKAGTGNDYYYDHVNRKIRTGQRTDNGSTAGTGIYLSRLFYNEISQVTGKWVGFDAILNDYLGKEGFTYNERGWLKKKYPTHGGTDFTEELWYNDPASGTPQYNGNIAQVFLDGGYAPNTTFTYTYDNLNRLTNAASSNNNLNETLSYDKVGNILTLTRAGYSPATLAYTYGNGGVSNNLATVTNSAIAYRTYAYDKNGNAKSDGGISPNAKTITYNLLNLPQTVTATAGTATYTYDATGNKLRNVEISGIKRDYISGIVYKQDTIDYVQTEEGRALIGSDTKYYYIYDIEDHLGNVRGSYKKTGSTRELLQEDEYYAFGLNKRIRNFVNENRYLYNGKEEQYDLTEQYDYGARFYDPVIARWTSVDPLAEKGRRWSTYVYGFNNPIKFVDPDGMWPDWGALWQAAKSPISPTATGIVALKGARNLAVTASAWLGGHNSHRALSKNPKVRAEAKAENINLSKSLATDLIIGYAGGKLLGMAGESPFNGTGPIVNKSSTVATANGTADAVSGLKLGKQLASEQQMGEAGQVIAGGNTGTPLRKASDLANEYGGSPSDWVKSTSENSGAFSDGTSFSTHWEQNIATGERVNIKVKQGDVKTPTKESLNPTDPNHK